jgi:hypothetical protein
VGVDDETKHLTFFEVLVVGATGRSLAWALQALEVWGVLRREFEPVRRAEVLAERSVGSVVGLLDFAGDAAAVGHLKAMFTSPGPDCH